MARGKLWGGKSISLAAKVMKDKMKKINYRKIVEEGRERLPKHICPMCLISHAEAVPDACWKRAYVTGSLVDFDRYLRANKKGRIDGLSYH